jgi:hypothetical protein
LDKRTYIGSSPDHRAAESHGGDLQLTARKNWVIERIKACSLLTKDKVKKIVQWPSMLDQLPIEEDAIGTSGSACNCDCAGQGPRREAEVRLGPAARPAMAPT